MKSKGKGRLFALAALAALAFFLTEADLQAMPPVARTVLKNQLVLLQSEDHSLPFVTLQLMIEAGSSRDPAGKEGLAYVTARGLMLGTALHSQTDINEKLDFLGASLDASSGRDYALLSLRVLKKDLDEGLALLQEVFTQPAFPEKELMQEKGKILATIQSEEDQPDIVAEKAFIKALFVSGPYGHPSAGTKESLPGITREDVLNFYRTYYHPNNCILAVAGDISPDEVKKKLVSLFEERPEGILPGVTVRNVFSDLSKGPVTVKIDRRISQANIVLGNRGISRGNPDFYALNVMNYILGGGGFASRMLEEIRNKRGLAYSVESFFDAGRYEGSFQVVLQTKNASAREAISLALGQMKLIREELVSEKELEDAKKYLIGSFPLRVDTQAKLAGFILQEEYYGLGLDYPEKYPGLISAVTREDVLRVAKAYLHPEKYVLVIVGDLKEAAPEQDKGK
jgi:zinc protease